MTNQRNLSLILASVALGVSIGGALWAPWALREPCPHSHVAPAPANPAPPPNIVIPTPPAPPPPTITDELATAIPATAGDPAEPGDLVLARWTDGTWWEATILSTADDGVTVAWADGSPPNQLPREHVAPLADATRDLPSGALAFCKWQTSTRWWRARIVSSHVHYIDATVEPHTNQCVAALPGTIGN